VADLTLKVPRAQAETVIDRRYAEGAPLLDVAAKVTDEASKKAWEHQVTQWGDVTARALRSLFSTDELAESFEWSLVTGVILYDDAANFRLEVEALGNALNRLSGIKGQLDYIPEPVAAEADLPEENSQEAKVFLVHGRNDAAKTQVARMLESTGEHEVVILHEQHDQGRTIIEKFEDYASRASVAVVLLTADDLGRLNPDYASEDEEATEQARARQNVVFELGYFVGLLGRSHVSVLYEPGVEVPSDYGGVLYTKLDEAGAWRTNPDLAPRRAPRPEPGRRIVRLSRDYAACRRSQPGSGGSP